MLLDYQKHFIFINLNFNNKYSNKFRKMNEKQHAEKTKMFTVTSD
jgi:hypothetical protein